MKGKGMRNSKAVVGKPITLSNAGSLAGKAFLVRTEFLDHNGKFDPNSTFCIERLFYPSGEAELLYDDGWWERSSCSSDSLMEALQMLLGNRYTKEQCHILQIDTKVGEYHTYDGTEPAKETKELYVKNDALALLECLIDWAEVFEGEGTVADLLKTRLENK